MSRIKIIEPKISPENYVSDLSHAFNWYNQEKDKKDAKVPGGRGHQPSTQWKGHRGGGRGRGGVGRCDGWVSAHTFQAPPHTGWYGGGGGYSLHAPGPSPYYNGGQFPPQSGRGGGPPGGRP